MIRVWEENSIHANHWHMRGDDGHIAASVCQMTDVSGKEIFIWLLNAPTWNETLLDERVPCQATLIGGL